MKMMTARIALFVTGVLAVSCAGGFGAATSTLMLDGLIVDTLDPPREDREESPPSFPRIRMGDMPVLPPVDDGSIPLDAPAYDRMPDRAQRHARQGEHYFAEEQWESALREYQRALRLDPHNPAYVHRVAVTATLAGNYGVADIHFDRFLRGHPDHVPSLLGHAGVLLRLKRFDEAEPLVDRAQELAPKDLGTKFNRTLLRVLDTEDVAAVRREWQRIEMVETLNIVQWLHADRDELSKAMSPRKFQMAVGVILGDGTQNHFPDIVQTLRMAVSAYQSGDRSAYADALEEVRRMGVYTKGVETHLARTYVELGEYQKAEAIMATLAGIYPADVVIRYNHGYTLMKSDSFEAAKQAFHDVIALDDTHADARFALACAYMSLDRADKAWPILVGLAGEHPDRMSAWLEGDAPYLVAIREHPDYAQLETLFD